MTYRRGSRVEEFYGANDINRMFPPDGAPTTPTPWHTMSRFKDRQDYDKPLVHEALRQAPELHDLDPRDLHATQPSVTREGVAYYMGRQFSETGRTFADQSNAGNRHPVVYQREDGQNLILSGHHRAAAALLRGDPLRARTVQGPFGPPRGGR